MEPIAFSHPDAAAVPNPLRLDQIDRSDRNSLRHVAEVAVVSGAAVSTWRPIGPGRHVIGTSRLASVRLDDALAEPHHALMTVDERGSVEVAQLCGIAPIQQALGPPSNAVGGCVSETRLTFGASVVAIRSRRASGRGAASGLTRVPWAAAPQTNRISSAPLDVPANVVGGSRENRPARAPRRGVALRAADETRLVASLDVSRLARTDEHDRTHRLAVEALTVLATADDSCSLWHRSDPTGSRLLASVGTGTVRWQPRIRKLSGSIAAPSVLRAIEAASLLPGRSAPISIRPNEVIAFGGATRSARSVIRSILVQLATWISPTDLTVTVLTDHVQQWNWVRSLPHANSHRDAVVRFDAEGLVRGCVAAGRSDGQECSRLVVVDLERSAADLDGLREVCDGDASMLVVGAFSPTRTDIDRSLDIGVTGVASWNGDVPDEDDAFDLRWHGLSLDTAQRAARRLRLLAGEGPVAHRSTPITTDCARIRRNRSGGSCVDRV